jgi:hypothetical protein
MYLRDIVQEPRYGQDLDDLRRFYPEMDQVQASIGWELSRDPRAGEPREYAPDFHLFLTGEAGDTPAFYILYSYDTDKVYLHTIAIAK